MQLFGKDVVNAIVQYRNSFAIIIYIIYIIYTNNEYFFIIAIIIIFRFSENTLLICNANYYT